MMLHQFQAEIIYRVATSPGKTWNLRNFEKEVGILNKIT